VPKPITAATFLLALACLLSTSLVMAQDATLTPADVTVLMGQDIYGQPTQVARGHLANNGADAYANISLTAEVYDAAGSVIGEGIGYPVNACGAALLPDFALQPGASVPFEVPLELYEAGAQIDRVEITPQADATTPTTAAPSELSGITRVSTDEVVEVEWLDSRALRFGVGCPRSLFTELDWFQHSQRTNTTIHVLHPRADDITEALRARLGLSDQATFENSALEFSPAGRRLVFQDEINIFKTAEPDGSFIRTLYSVLYNRTLQGIDWLPEGRFLAYYYGAFGDPVIYFTADEEGRPISLAPENAAPSDIVPGASPDARRAIIGGTLEEVTGYYLEPLTNLRPPELLFESEVPGNNWPAPLWTIKPNAVDGEPGDNLIYIARMVDGEARLQCFTLADREPRDLTALPLRLATDERARWWLSPDARTIALAATGLNGGLWLIDLTAFPACGE
jgi:hypothetical protein